MGAKGFIRFFYLNEDWRWDFLDFGLVLTYLMEVIALNTAKPTMKNLALLRLIRLARILSIASRFVRSFKITRFFRPIRVLLRSIFFTMKPLVWILMLLLVVMYVFALLFTAATKTYLDDTAPDADLKRLFGSIPISVFTLYMSVTGGLDWQEIIKVLGVMGGLWPAVYVTYQFFFSFAIMNVITAVFCQSALESAQNDQSLVVEEHIAGLEVHVGRFRELFNHLDSDHSGSLTLAELETNLKDEVFQAYFSSMDIDVHDAWTLFSLLDNDNTDDIDIDEFVMGCLRLKGVAKAVDIIKVHFETRGLTKKVHTLQRELRTFFRDFDQVKHLLAALTAKSPCKDSRPTAL